MSYLVLHKVAPDENQARYYALTWQPALTGGWIVERAWGRLSSRSRQYKTDSAADVNDAMAVVRSHLRRRLRHGYKVIEGDRDADDILESPGVHERPRDTND